MSSSFHHAGGASMPDPAQMAAIARIAYSEAGIVIAPGKTSMVQSRLAKRLRALDLPDYDSYLELVDSEAGQEERRRMISALTTNVSHFFREAHHFDTLRNEVLPPLLAKVRAGGRARLWSAGCSNGQEAWSMAMTVLDLMPDAPEHDLRILATDIDPLVVEKGRSATYDTQMVAGVDPALRKRFFEAAAGQHRLIPAAQSLVSFHELNLHAPWPMRGPFDAIFCRNVVIYFDAETQDRLWHRFAEVLPPGGWLMVGHSERVPVAPASRFVTAGITTYRLPPAAGNK
ncbi:protein-glutamate O-methyltransferase CheR [Frigidibacter sp.]|uniref:CheR family methyltransferase n=1 Tax=Frigidibacter sp. TaxID=2586418 RepID=UPI002733E368|nr:protein-glutamate O-methyltransferase [Frigidibacter sp.]MDP3341022.1 protein-glutamate O-methyltransferase [Frigidibacter sp.]